MTSHYIPRLKAEIAELEALYDRTENRIEQRGGVDYRGELASIRKQLEKARRELERWTKFWAAGGVDYRDLPSDPNKIAEALVNDEFKPESIHDIAADFIEDELGRFDWRLNWQTLKEKEDPVQRVQQFLDQYSIPADAVAVVEHLNRLVDVNPGLWK